MNSTTRTLSTTKINMGNGRQESLCLLFDGIPTWQYHAAHIDELARSIQIGHEVYTPAAADDVADADWYEGKSRGDSPRFQQLIKTVAGRGIALRYTGNRYWAAVEIEVQS